MAEQDKIQPDSVQHEEPQRNFEVLEDGKVKMTETQVSTVIFSSRDFASYVRTHEQEKQNFDYYLQNEGQEYLKEQSEKEKNIIDKMKPYLEESEKKAEEARKKKVGDEIVKNIKEFLAKEDAIKNSENLQRAANLKETYENLSDEHKKQFTEEEVNKVYDYTKKAKRKLQRKSSN